MHMPKLDLKGMIGIHQGRERSDVLLAIVLPAVLMLVSAYTNAWAFTGGNLSFANTPTTINTIDAMFRGLFVEALVFSSFKLVKMLCSSGKWYNYPAALVPAFLGLEGVIVSAGCGLAWVAKSGSMDWMIHTVSAYLPDWMTVVFQSGLGLLFPVALAVLAVYDIGQLIHEHIKDGAQLSALSLLVHSAEHHQEMLKQAQLEANNDPQIKNAYKQMAQNNAQQAVNAAKAGDYTFGLESTMQTQALQSQPTSSVTPITTPLTALNGPVPMRQLPPAMMPAMNFQQQPSFPPQQQPITAQVGPAGAPTGNTTNLQMPPMQPNLNMFPNNLGPYRP